MKALNSYKIQHRKDGRYAVKVGNRGTVIQLYAKTKQQLKEKLADVLKQIEEARLYELENQTRSTTRLKDWARCCLENYSKPHVTGNTYASYLNILHHHLGELGEKPIGGISCIMIQQHLLGLKKVKSDEPLSPKMLLNIRNFLSMVFRLAIQNRILLRNPVDGVILPKGAVRKPRALTRDEQATLIRVVRKSKRLLMFAVVLALYTGMRKGEILGLQWRDVDLDAKRISVNKQLTRHYDITEPGDRRSVLDLTATKTESSVRFVYLFDELADEFMAYKEKMMQWKIENGFEHSENDFVFCNHLNTAIEPRRFYQYYKELLNEAGIENANFHTLRHTFTTRCLESGIDIVTISKMLGHTTTRLTADTYSHLLDEYKATETEKIRKAYVPIDCD